MKNIFNLKSYDWFSKPAFTDIGKPGKALTINDLKQSINKLTITPAEVGKQSKITMGTNSFLSSMGTLVNVTAFGEESAHEETMEIDKDKLTIEKKCKNGHTFSTNYKQFEESCPIPGCNQPVKEFQVESATFRSR